MKSRSKRSSSEQGFTLVESLIAIFILSFGIISITQLSAVAIGSNSSARNMTTSTFVASQRLEALMVVPYSVLTDTPTTDSLTVDTAGYFEDVTVGTSRYHTRWRVVTVPAYAPNLKFIQVRTEAAGFLGPRSRVDLTSFRSCVTPNGDAGATCPALP